MIDYSKWIGKTVYVSDESVEQAREYKISGETDNRRVLVSYGNNKDYPFGVDTGSAWRYAVLADEEEEEMDELKFGDLVECRDSINEEWGSEKIYFGKKGDLFLVMFPAEWQELGQDMDAGKKVFAYYQCRKVPTKEYTMEELEKIVGHKFIIKP